MNAQTVAQGAASDSAVRDFLQAAGHEGATSEEVAGGTGLSIRAVTRSAVRGAAAGWCRRAGSRGRLYATGLPAPELTAAAVEAATATADDAAERVDLRRDRAAAETALRALAATGADLRSLRRDPGLAAHAAGVREQAVALADEVAAVRTRVALDSLGPRVQAAAHAVEQVREAIAREVSDGELRRSAAAPALAIAQAELRARMGVHRRLRATWEKVGPSRDGRITGALLDVSLDGSEPIVERTEAFDPAMVIPADLPWLMRQALRASAPQPRVVVTWTSTVDRDVQVDETEMRRWDAPGVRALLRPAVQQAAVREDQQEAQVRALIAQVEGRPARRLALTAPSEAPVVPPAGTGALPALTAGNPPAPVCASCGGVAVILATYRSGIEREVCMPHQSSAPPVRGRPETEPAVVTATRPQRPGTTVGDSRWSTCCPQARTRVVVPTFDRTRGCTPPGPVSVVHTSPATLARGQFPDVPFHPSGGGSDRGAGSGWWTVPLSCTWIIARPITRRIARPAAG